MLPFRRFKRDAYMLDQCATMVEGTVHEIGEYVNKDEDMTDSMTQTLFHLLDVYNDLLDVLDDDELTVNPRLHFRQYPRVRGYIRDSCNRCRSAVGQLTQLVNMQDELNDIECYANGELDFGGDF